MNAGISRGRSKRLLVAALSYAALLFGVSQVPGEELARIGFDIWDKAAHTAAYAPLGALVLAWLLSRGEPKSRRSLAARVAAAIAVATAYGLSDELHQAFVPGREPSILDLVADFVGACLGALAVVFFSVSRRARRTPKA